MTQTKLPALTPAEPFDLHDKRIFMWHGAVLGFALAVVLPDVPEWALSYEGRATIGFAFAGVSVALVGMKMAVGAGWKQVALAVGTVLSGLTLGASGRLEGAPYAPACVLFAAAGLFYCLSVLARNQHKSKPRETTEGQPRQESPRLSLTPRNSTPCGVSSS